MDWSKLSVSDIKKVLGTMSVLEIEKNICFLENDPRSGVRNIVDSLKKQVFRHYKELERISSMKKYEDMYMKKGAKYIAGVDEVGRGPLAGPVYAAAVILPVDCIIEGINDSKKLSPQKRKKLWHEIKSKALSIGIGSCDEKTIDKINILNASFEAMRQAINSLQIKPDVILVDAVKIPDIDIFQVPIVKGDSLSVSIAAASIIAKVERDEVMNKFHSQYPVYNFMSNKGYGTMEHIKAIKEYGLCHLHRRTFVNNFLKNIKGSE